MDSLLTLGVRNGKMVNLPTMEEVTVSGDWEGHAAHGKPIDDVQVKHVLYTGMRCPCGVILIDEEQ